MALFRRGAKDIAPDDITEAEVDAEVETPDEDVVEAPARTRGPWDVDEVEDEHARVDLGALRVPGIPGMELRMEIDKATEVVSAASVSIEGSQLQLQAYAAPRTDGIWDEIREEIAASVVQQGGSVDDLPGPFGRELLARLPVRTAEGRTGHRPARFLGVDGPRWFVRGVITGKAAVEPAAAAVLEQVFGGVVVVRGTEAHAPRDLLGLRLPGPASAPAEDEAEPAAPSFDPLERGPEITETR
ncbi:DUF3710 domain-containing protein [Cellulomonas sp. PhB150]|uniref:DUF3710 domain-containing protein n=1 Tax=Cellulomonas sp. PhB150 TaxID=2485188 RepID=UPI000F48BB50|nr:DUF3710 domain-containing protein [Cellulomonas sp. PhB150]ROS30866.1 uncharacterized protein DUF3710 [Cellulomonas sp. PhB150]